MTRRSERPKTSFFSVWSDERRRSFSTHCSNRMDCFSVHFRPLKDFQALSQTLAEDAHPSVIPSPEMHACQELIDRLITSIYI